jgi:predicted MPP superfamily phosphohydrolase
LSNYSIRVSPRFGFVGCFGNHDSAEFKQAAARLPMPWLADEAMDHPDLPLLVGGIDCQYKKKNTGDAMKMALSIEPDARGRFHLGLAHLPHWLPPLAALGFDLVLSGHTHGGQVRLPGPRPLYNASKHWPLEFTSGIVRMNRTTSVISRGLGESMFEGLRICCRPMVATLQLTEGPTESFASPGLIEAW